MTTNKNPFLFWVILLVAVFLIGMLWIRVENLERKLEKATTSSQGLTPTASSIRIRPVDENDHLMGEKNAPIILIEYSDLECPYCRSFQETMKQVMEEYSGKVAWVYRHFPLDQIHPKARKEAQATECAAELGGNEGFWKMVDKIFEVTPSNNGLNLDDLPSLASQIGLDPVKFKNCLEEGRYAGRVEEDYQEGVKIGVRGTPATMIIDTKGKSKLIPGALPYDSLKQTIEEALKS